MGKEEIKEIKAFRFAGQVYETREEAERALAHSDLHEFVQKSWDGVSDHDDQARILTEWLEIHRGKITTLLCKGPS